MTDEILKSQPIEKKHGGARPNSGRPKGGMNQATRDKIKVMQEYDQKVMKAADKLFNAKMTLATGQTFLYKIEKEKVVGPKGGEYIKSKKPKLVTDTWEIEDYLNGEIDGNHDLTAPEDTYYFLTTKEPMNNAIEDMLNRVHGKAKQNVDVTSAGKQLQGNTINFIDGES